MQEAKANALSAGELQYYPSALISPVMTTIIST